MNIPLLDIRSEQAGLKDELLKAINRVVESGRYILGPEVKTLEERIASYCGVQFGIGVSSGTDALLVSLMALNIGSEDEVITTDYSFFATAGVIARMGAKPVFVDIDPVTFNIDPSRIERAITQKTKAMIVVHLYGQCAEMEMIMKIAGQYKIPVIEDAAQAIGAQYSDGCRAGSIGHLGCFSFFPSKNLGTLGDGGMVITDDPDLSERLSTLRVHGAKPKYYHRLIGGNFRLDEIQAAVLNVKMDSLEQWSLARQRNADLYEERFKESDLINKERIRLPVAVYCQNNLPFYHIYNQYVIRVHARDRLRQYLKEQGISTEVYYSVPFHLQECFQDLGYNKRSFPEAERAARETLALPIYPSLSATSIQRIVETISGFYAD